MPKSDPLLDALDSLTPTGKTSRYKVLELFSDRPEVLDGIRSAAARRVSPAQIAEALSAKLTGDNISGSAVQSWLKSEKSA